MTDAREVLLKLQNADGGWGYYPGRKSCLEPTAWSMIALGDGPAVERGWHLLRAWQLEEGAWQSGAQVDEPGWATSLVVLLHAIRNDFGESCRRGVNWLLGQRGAPDSLLALAQRLLSRQKLVDMDTTIEAWPWREGNSAWVEPTSYAMLALRAVGGKIEPEKTKLRLEQGERMLMNRRCKDGGWNYGNRRVLETDLESFPETTAAALLALHNGIQRAPLDVSLQRARHSWERTPTPLATAMLRTTFRVWEQPFEEPPLPAATMPTETTTLAFEAIGQQDGAWRRLAALGRS